MRAASRSRWHRDSLVPSDRDHWLPRERRLARDCAADGQPRVIPVRRSWSTGAATRSSSMRWGGSEFEVCGGGPRPACHSSKPGDPGQASRQVHLLEKRHRATFHPTTKGPKTFGCLACPSCGRPIRPGDAVSRQLGCTQREEGARVATTPACSGPRRRYARFTKPVMFSHPGLDFDERLAGHIRAVERRSHADRRGLACA